MSEDTGLRVQLVSAEGTVRAETALDPGDAGLIAHQLALCVDSHQSEAFLARLRRAIGAAVVEAVQYDLKPPTRAQKEFAMAIAASLSVPLSPEVLQFRGQMHIFLDEHAAAYRNRRRVPSPASSAPTARSHSGEPDDDIPF